MVIYSISLTLCETANRIIVLMDSCLFGFVVYILQQYQKYMRTNRNFKGLLFSFIDIDINDEENLTCDHVQTASQNLIFTPTRLKPDCSLVVQIVTNHMKSIFAKPIKKPLSGGRFNWHQTDVVQCEHCFDIVAVRHRCCGSLSDGPIMRPSLNKARSNLDTS